MYFMISRLHKIRGIPILQNISTICRRKHRPLYADVPHHFLSTSRVPKRPLCAGGATAISVYTGRVPHARGAAHPIRGQHDAHQSGASFPQELPVVIFAIKHCVSILLNTFIAMHPLEVYLNQAGRGLTHSGGSAMFIQPRSTYSVGMASAVFQQSLSVGPTPTVARGQSSGSRDVASRRHDTNRHCREQVIRSEPQGYRVLTRD